MHGSIIHNKINNIHLQNRCKLIAHLSSAIFRPSSSEDESEDEMMALDLIFPLRDGGMRSGLDLKKTKKNAMRSKSLHPGKCILTAEHRYLLDPLALSGFALLFRP